MQEHINALALGAIILGILAVAIILNRRNRRRVIKAEEAQREAERAAEAREEQKLATRRLARARARIAYPELLDAAEADTLTPLRPVPDYDDKRIREALKLLEEEVGRVETARAARRSNPNLPDLDEEYEVLCALLDARWKGWKREHPSAYLEKPARLIDCGDAGRIELFSSADVEAAREQSGFAGYVIIMKRAARAPEVAELIIGRAKAHAEMIERKRRKAEAAITTKASDLPPLPPQDIRGPEQ